MLPLSSPPTAPTALTHPSPPPFEVADIVRAYGAAFRATYTVSPEQARVLRAIAQCRTAALGGHVEPCVSCGTERVCYDSCRNRPCPKCQGRARAKWLAAEQALLLSIPYFHVVFTLPSELHELWRWNREVLTELFFTSVRETLQTLLGDPKWLGAQPGILAALHTWGRTLALPPHVHCLVSGGGLEAEGQWQSVRTGFLLPVAVVRSLFRGKVLGALEDVWCRGQLQLPPHLDDDGMRRVLVAAARQKWNIRLAERYTHGRGVMTYLARYVRGGPIKDHRFVAFDGQQVTFRYGNHRDLDDAGQPHQAELTLSVGEFLRRWSEHVPLPGVHMVRAWGLYASTQRAKLAQCRDQLPEKDTIREMPQAAEARSPDTRPWEQCPMCQQPMVLVHVLPRAGAPPRVEAWPVAA